MRYFSVCSGIGGFELGIGERGKCVGFSEIDKYAIQIYQKHFPSHKNYGDIKKIDAKKLPDFDLICGGFPCQSFSVAGKRKGFNDARGTIFFDICRIIKIKKPRLILLENVKGLLSHDDGRTFIAIIAALDELGYDCQWQVLNSKDFGVPQNRERIFVVGHLRGSRRPQVFPITQSGKVHTKAQQGSGETIAPCLHAASGGPDVNDLFVEIPEATRGGYAVARLGDSINLSVMGSKTRRGRVGKGVAQTLDTGMQQYTIYQKPRGKSRGGAHAIAPAMTGKSYEHNNTLALRRLTPRECERLQGFPDDWTAGVSDTQRYKVCGNAVTTNVVRAIIQKMI